MVRRAAPAAVLLAVVALAAGSTGSAATGALTVDVAADNHSISPYIYGMSNADPALAAQIGLPVDRYGGNLADTYNWQADMQNTGNDYYFENLPGCWNDAEGWCSDPPLDPSSRYRNWVDADRTTSTKSLIVLPLMGRVAAGPPRYDHPFVCGFPRTANSGQASYDQYDTNCGNGKVEGKWITPTQDWIAAGPSWNEAWLADITSHFGQASAGGVMFYGLGNEPGLWNDTHHDMHPSPDTYDELWQATRDNAIKVRTADPTAQILAFSEWGWPNYFCSSADDLSDGCDATDTDRAAHGGTPLVRWLLQQGQAYETANGVRLFDYLDLHYYPQGGNPPQNLRSLYDPTYVDPSWIGEVIDLLPSMRSWIAADYPGTKIAISEWDWGDNNGVRGTLTDAEVLGIFAREQVDLAAKWDPPAASQTAANAWRIYRNYDGSHHGFGQTWVRSTSTVSGLQVFGAKRTDGALTVLVANDTGGSITAPLSVANATLPGTAQVWRWQSSSPGKIVRAADQPVSGGGFSASYPAKSLTLLVFAPGGSGGPAPTIGSFSPTKGPVGTKVTLTGTGFTGATKVKFGGTAATTLKVVSATTITTKVPTGAVTGTILVKTPAGTATSSTPFKVTK
jgi:hypothetical protein